MDLKELIAGKLGVFLSHVEKIYTGTPGGDVVRAWPVKG